jgi:hypothetical protein
MPLVWDKDVLAQGASMRLKLSFNAAAETVALALGREDEETWRHGLRGGRRQMPQPRFVGMDNESDRIVGL